MPKSSSTKKVNTVYLVGSSGKMGRAILNLTTSQKEYQITSSVKEADVIIDFSSPEGTESSLTAALHHQVPLVIGTTGLPKELEKKIESASVFIPILSSPNFSFGIAIFLKILPEIVKNIKQDYGCKIVEIHHVHKKDSPSGTALKLAHAIDKDVSIESRREGEVIGEHRIFFNLLGETLELRHEAQTRDAFARGALMAANFLVNKPPGLYTLMDLLN